jgi:hypothetical protein
VDHADANPVDLDHAPLRERLAERGLVHVPVHRLDRAELAQFVEYGDRNDVAEVEDQIGFPTAAQAVIGEPPRAARQVSVRDDRDPGQLSSRNRPSR